MDSDGSVNKYTGKSIARVSESVDFLKRIWIYSSLDARCFAVVWICGEKLQYRHYCFDACQGGAGVVGGE